MRFMLAAALLIAATACGDGKTVDRPALDSVGADSMVVDSGGASRGTSFLHFASYGATMAVDSSQYTISWRVGSYATGDTVQVKLVRDSVAGKVTRVSITKNRFESIGSVAIKVDKIYGTVAKYSACTRLRRTTVKIEMCQNWSTNFLLPDTMIVDSSLALAKLDIKPDAPRLEYGQKQQFCAFLVFKDGKVAMRTPDKLIPECPVQYASWPPEKRSVTPAQQMIADRTCIKWSATGGTIQAETCATDNPLLGHPA